MAYYEMKVFIDSQDIDLLRMYEAARDKHNAVFLNKDIKEADKYYDAGFDLFCPDEMVIRSGSHGVKVDQRVKCSMKLFSTQHGNKNVGYYLYPRSSTGTKTPLRLSNSVGIIDSGYRGNITAVFDNINININIDISEAEGFVIEKYQRLVQICPPDLSYPFIVTLVSNMNDLGNKTSRGSCGFGSTGK